MDKKIYEHTKFYIKDIYLRKILEKNLSPQATKLLLILHGHRNDKTGICNPSQKLLGMEMDRSVRTIQRYLRELVKKGFIAVKKTGKMLTNKYFLKVKEELENFKQQYKKSKEAGKEIKEKCKKFVKNKNKKNDVWNYKNDYTKYNNIEKIEKKLLGWT